MGENSTITEIKIGGKLVPFIQDNVTNNGKFFIVDSNDISFGNDVMSVTEKVNTINNDLIDKIDTVDTKLTQDIEDKYTELLEIITKNQDTINHELTVIKNRLLNLEMAVSGDTTKVELELMNTLTSAKGSYTVKAKTHVYNGDEVQSYKWYINNEVQSFESNEFTKSYDNNTSNNITDNIKCEITTKNGITVISDILEVTIPGIQLNEISISPTTATITESNHSIQINVSGFTSPNYNNPDKKFECKWQVLNNTYDNEINEIFIMDGDKKTVAWSSVVDGKSSIDIQSGTVSDKRKESITIRMTPQLGDGDISTDNLENINIGKSIDITIKVGKDEVINYYWYIGTENPANMTSITPVVNDNTSLGWRLIGTRKPTSSTFTESNMLWNGVNNGIFFSRSTSYIAIPYEPLQMWDADGGDGLFYTIQNNGNPININGVDYYIYMSDYKTGGFEMNIYNK